MAFNYDDCVKKGLLRKIPVSKDKASRSIEKAEKWLIEAESTLKSSAFNSSVLDSYMTMFHSARAILFFDGWREKSHACVARYLEGKYVKSGKLEKGWVELLDLNRDIRHDDQYDLSFFSTQEDAVKALESAKKFLERMKTLHNSISSHKG